MSALWRLIVSMSVNMLDVRRMARIWFSTMLCWIVGAMTAAFKGGGPLIGQTQAADPRIWKSNVWANTNCYVAITQKASTRFRNRLVRLVHQDAVTQFISQTAIQEFATLGPGNFGRSA